MTLEKLLKPNVFQMADIGHLLENDASINLLIQNIDEELQEAAEVIPIGSANNGAVNHVVERNVDVLVRYHGHNPALLILH
jgi:hypothetical protein